MRFWTSDIHFGHRNIIDYCNRPFSDPDAMNEEIIRRWNEVVSPDDDVYVLGDVALGKISETLPLVSRLAGNLFLCPGNHDRCWIGNKKGRESWEDKYEAAGFILVPEQAQTFFINEQGLDILVNVCHFPYEGDSHDDDRYAEYRIPRSDLPILHGHVHDAWKTNGNQFNVGMDVHDFRPVSDEVIVSWLSDLEKE